MNRIRVTVGPGLRVLRLRVGGTDSDVRVRLRVRAARPVAAEMASRSGPVRRQIIQLQVEVVTGE
jgi:hypothetical protein